MGQAHPDSCGSKVLLPICTRKTYPGRTSSKPGDGGFPHAHGSGAADLGTPLTYLPIAMMAFFWEEFASSRRFIVVLAGALLMPLAWHGFEALSAQPA